MPLVAGSSARASSTSLLKSSFSPIASTNCVLATISSRTAARVTRVHATGEPEAKRLERLAAQADPGEHEEHRDREEEALLLDSVPSNMKPLAARMRVVTVAIDGLDEVNELRGLDIGNELEVLEDEARHPDTELRAVARDSGRAGLWRAERLEVLPQAGERLQPVDQRLDAVAGASASVECPADAGRTSGSGLCRGECRSWSAGGDGSNQRSAAAFSSGEERTSES